MSVRSEGKCYTYHRWQHFVCAKGDMWCQRGVQHFLVQDHTYQCCWYSTNCVALYSLHGKGRCGPIVGWQQRGCYLRWRAGVFSRTSSHIWDNCNLPMFLLWDGSSTLMFMTSFMVLSMLYASLSTMGKLSTVSQHSPRKDNCCVIQSADLGK